MQPQEFQLKTISHEAVPAAIERAERYRLLNDPDQAVSICLDVLRAEPENQKALILLILSTTDGVGRGICGFTVQAARAALDKLVDEYQCLYYSGIICERQARAFLLRGPSAHFAYDGLRDAMQWYEKAEGFRPEGNDETILRWNACARIITQRKLRPWSDDRNEQPLE